MYKNCGRNLLLFRHENFEHHQSSWEVFFVLFLDLGAWKWQVEVVTYRSHKYCQGISSQSKTTLSVFMRGRQASQMLGPGVQQGEYM